MATRKVRQSNTGNGPIGASKAKATTAKRKPVNKAKAISGKQPARATAMPTSASGAANGTYYVPAGVRGPVQGSVIEAIYAHIISKRGHTATGRDIADTVGTTFKQPQTGKVHGTTATLATIRWLVKRGRLGVIES